MASHARRTLTVLGVTALLASGMTGLSGTAFAEPPNIPDDTTARSLLDQLTVQPDGSQDGYDRDEFPHWSDQGDSCNTRELVLKRDGTDVQTGADCYPTSGSWFSPFDEATWTDPQLIAVTDNVNQEKGDKGPEAWKPPAEGYWCTYSKMWVAVKHKWQLSTSEDEKSALLEMLDRC